MVTIALDAMGGDHAPEVVIEGAARAAREDPEVRFVLVGHEEVIRGELHRLAIDGEWFTIQHAAEVVEMGDKPSLALRNKKDSSMRVAANLVKGGQVEAMVSAGNTGALMAIAKYVLKTLPGIDRPAIAAMLPSVHGQTLMLDVGANVDCTADHLVQFALMGDVYATAVLEIAQPKVGLLNIGEEEVKGNEVVRQAGERLKLSMEHYMGYVESTDIFLGDVDVVVCDGFVGNVSLKTVEGAAQMLARFLKEAYGYSWLTKLGYLASLPAVNRFRQRVDHRRYNGAMLLGLNGVVVKSHGGADAFAFAHAIQSASGLVRGRVNDKIRDHVLRMQRVEVGE